MKTAIKLWITLPLLLAVFLINTPYPAYAYGEVLGTNIVSEQSISVGGIKIESPTNPITINTPKPTFAGYTTPNSTVTLIFHSNPIIRTTLSDATGYWTYTLDTPLPPGRHTVSTKTTDSNGVTSAETLLATFDVANPKSPTPFPTFAPNLQPNYMNAAEVILGAIVVLGLGYAFLSKRGFLNK